MSVLNHITSGFMSLLTGLRITLRQSVKKSVTQQYPHEKPEMSKAYRGSIKLILFDETETHDCVACMQCVKICPSYCIEIEGGKVDGLKRKRATVFDMDFALCSLCGLCIDVCPTDTLEHSKEYDEVSDNRNWVMDLLEPFADYEDEFRVKWRAVEEKEAAAKAAKKEAAAKAKAEAAAAKEAEEAAAGGNDTEEKPGDAEETTSC